VSKTSNVGRQLARQISAQPEREESKQSIKKLESMATFIKTSPKPVNGKTFNKNGKGKKKEECRRLPL